NGGGDGMLRRRHLLRARELEQMIVSRAFIGIAKDVIGAHDLSGSQRSTGIAGSDVGVGAFDGSPERRPESFGVIVWKRSEQIVKRRHYRSRCWICSAPSEFPQRITQEHAYKLNVTGSG